VRKVFTDAHHLIARINPREEWHRAAREAERLLEKSVLQVTTHEVLTELLAGVSGFAYLRTVAVQTIHAMKRDPLVRVIPPSEALFHRGLELYDRRRDKEFSLVDCISMVVMKEEGITEVLSHDHHFEQEGFNPLIRKP
jgi:uncharacterized protein